MKALSKEQIRQRDEIVAQLDERRKNIEAAIEAANEKIDEIREDLVAVRDKYNEEVTKLATLRDEIVTDIENYVEEKSEKWQDSEAGSSYATWRDRFSDTDLDGIDIEMPEDIDTPDIDHGGEAEAWPESPE
jgi:DNA repair exonuclease SbcCD ATPase subunit